MSNEITQAPGEHGWAWLVLVWCSRMHPRGSQSILWSYEHVLAAHGMLRARLLHRWTGRPSHAPPRPNLEGFRQSFVEL